MDGSQTYMINAYDVETYEKDSKIIAYCVCFSLEKKMYSLYYEEGRDIIIESLNLIILNSTSNLIELYIHNLNFDGMLIINHITKHKIRYNIVSNRTNLYFLEIFYISKVIKFRCSYKLMPMGLRLIGELEKHPKTYFPYRFVSADTLNYSGAVPDEKYWNNDDFKNYLKLNSSIFDLKKKSIEYCINDVMLTVKFLRNVIKIVDTEQKDIIKNSYSAASLSHKIFYKKYNTKGVSEKIYEKDEMYIRRAYFGGRCEVFGNIKESEHIKYFDFSGMYGQCMLENFHNGQCQYTIDADLSVPGFHTIEYESNLPYLPILPSHSETGKLMFKNGRAVGTFWFEEILLFIKNGGRIVKKINSLVYKDYEPIFTDFINSFTKIKEKGGYYKIFGKLMINSLYGSMALSNKRERLFITFSEDEALYIIKNYDPKNYYKLNETYIIIIEENYKTKNFFKGNKTLDLLSLRNVSYAASIASKARIKLYNELVTVLDDGGRLLYCDTDSIFAAYSKNNVTKNTKNFTWLEFYEDGVFIAPKTYGLRANKNEIRIKGISQKDITYERLKYNFYNERDLTFENQLNIKKASFDLEQRYVAKKIALNKYDKRLFINNKTETIPLNT